MINKIRASYLINLLSLLFFTALTFAALVMQEITIFYVIYIFWWDEFIKVLFDYLRFTFNKKEIENPVLFRVSIGSRFFMLFIYIVFIIVCFGFVIEWNTNDSIAKNAQILFFRNIFFNISLVSFIAREIYVYRNKVQTLKNSFIPNMMSGSLITLHLSIIFGILLWAVATKKIGSFPLELGSYRTIIAIVPFLMIKFLFEWLGIKKT